MKYPSILWAVLTGWLALPGARGEAGVVPGTAETIKTGAITDGFPDFIGPGFMNGAVTGTLKAANLNGASSTLSPPAAGLIAVEATTTAGLPWLAVSSGAQIPSTANSGTTINFTGPADQAARDRIANTGFHGTNEWSLQLTTLIPGATYRVQLLTVDGFAAPPGRNFDILVDGVLVFDNFNPPGLGQDPFSGIAQFEAVAAADGRLTISTAAGTTAVSADANPYLCALAVTQITTDPRPPVVSRQPSAVSRGAGDPATVSVMAAGSTPLAYQWLHNGLPIAGATSAALDFPALTLENAGAYQCRVTNAFGEILSDPAAINVFAQPTGLLSQVRGWWRFDETTGESATDASAYGNHGTLVNFPPSGQWVAGRTGGALQFGGPAGRDFVRVPQYLIPRRTMTVSAWVWADSRPAWASIAKTWLHTGASSFRFGLQEATGSLSTFLQTTPGTQITSRETGQLPTGSWQHVAFTADGSTLRIFRNGSLTSTQPYSGALASSDLGPLGIGARLNAAGTEVNPGTPGYWHGKIDDLAIWSRALNPAEISAIHQGGLTGLSLAEIDTTPPAGGVVISEFMASNVGLLDDEDGDSPDWIEIYNGTDASVNLGGWRLTDMPDQPFKWTFPSTVLPARSFLIVFASGKNKSTPGQPLHTNFKLSTTGEPLALLQPDGSVACAFTPAYPPQVANVSCGLQSPDLASAPAGSPAFNALVRYYPVPSPGYTNSPGEPATGPRVTELTHAPAIASDEDPLVVSAQIDPTLAPITTATVTYRVNFGPETTVAMEAGGQNIWSASIPAAAAAPGQLVRYAVNASDSEGRTTRWPPRFIPATQPHFQGTIVADPAITTPLPVVHWFVQSRGAAETATGTRCSLFYDGALYDNIFVRIRGNTSINWPKKSYKLEFNKDAPFLYRRDAPAVSEIDINTTYTDKSYVRAAMAGSFMNAAGLPTVDIFHTHVRQNGNFYSLALMTENPDRDHLRRVGLDPDGAYYKGANGATLDSTAGYEKKSRENEGTADLQALVTGVAMTGSNLERFVFDHIDVPSMVNYMACMAITQDIDGSDKNHFLYRDTQDTREWRMLPWDIDLTFGPNALNTDTIVYNQQSANAPPNTSHPFIGARPYLLHDGKYMRLLEAIVKTPRARRMLLRRVRTLNDEFLAASYFQNRIDTLVPLLAADVVADKARWGGNTHFPGTTYSLVQATNRIKTEYLARRPTYLTGTTIAGVTTTNPAAQPSDAVITFGPAAITPPTTQEEEYIRLDNPNTFDVDVSQWTVEGEITWTLKPGTVIEAGGSLFLTPNAAAFRARTTSPKGGEALQVQGNYRGQLSARGGSLTLRRATTQTIAATTTYAGTPSPAQQWLRISEIMYHPTNQSDAEFIEFVNTGPVTLDLAGIAMINGVEFNFSRSTLTSLAPGGRTLIVKNADAMTAAYGPNLPIAGTFLGSLNNDGERLQLVDATGENILDFTFSPLWQPATAGQGFALTHSDPTASHRAWDDPAYWQPGKKIDGTPGLEDPPAFDTDGDGQLDQVEGMGGSDARSPASRFEVRLISQLPDGSVQLLFPAAAGRAYEIQQSVDAVTWQPASQLTASPVAYEAVIILPPLPASGPFFRVTTRGSSQ